MPLAGRPAVRSRLLVLVLLGLMAASASAQQRPSKGGRTQPNPPPDLQPHGQFQDGAATQDGRVFGDARELRLACDGDQVKGVLRMARPLVEGVFTCLHLDIDCDDNPKTGLGGDELLIRAAVGSRFQPSSARPTNGTRAAIDHTRISGTRLVPDGHGGKSWLHMRISADNPLVRGDSLEFAFPLSLVRERGDRYHTRFSVKAHVITSCSDQPIELLHSCSDAGIPIQVDGSDVDWSGDVQADAGDELHVAYRCADLTGLRVEHSDDALFAAVTLAGSGFATWEHDEDVAGVPWVTFLVEPLFPRYQEPQTVRIPGGWDGGDFDMGGGSNSSAIGDKCIEARFRRLRGQGRFRVIVHSDVELIDRFEGALKLQPEVR